MASRTHQMLTIIPLFYMVLGANGDTCEPNQASAHPSKCSSFHLCDKEGRPHEFDCPEGLHFNRLKSFCDWPQDAECLETQIPQDLERKDKEEDKVEVPEDKKEKVQHGRSVNNQESGFLTQDLKKDNENYEFNKESIPTYNTESLIEENIEKNKNNAGEAVLKRDNNNENFESVVRSLYTIKRQIYDSQESSEDERQNTTSFEKYEHSKIGEHPTTHYEDELQNKTETNIFKIHEAIANVLREQLNLTSSYIPLQPLGVLDFDDLTGYEKLDKSHSSGVDESDESLEVKSPPKEELGVSQEQVNNTDTSHEFLPYY